MEGFSPHSGLFTNTAVQQWTFTPPEPVEVVVGNQPGIAMQVEVLQAWRGCPEDRHETEYPG
jgi:hypothetical protein